MFKSVIVIAVSALAIGAQTPPPAPSFQTPFATNDPFKAPIPANAQLDPNSDALIAHNIGNSSVAELMSYSAARTIYYSGPDDPTYNVTFSYVPSWGPNAFDQTVTSLTGTGKCNPLHIPADAARPDSQYDRWMVVIDSTKPGLVCEIWRADKSSGTWTGAFGGVSDINNFSNHHLAGYLTGSGISASAGLIRASDVRAGAIEHALIFPSGCNVQHQSRYPATGSDGQCKDTAGFQMGIHLQLDPAFDCNSVPAGLSRMVCRALQVYGAYDGDSTGDPNSRYMEFGMETDDHSDPARSPWQKPGNYTRPGALYAANGCASDYCRLSSIPMNRLRVLAPPTAPSAPSGAPSPVVQPPPPPPRTGAACAAAPCTATYPSIH